MNDVPKIRVSLLEGCARCQGRHRNIMFEKLVHAQADIEYEYWAPCPENGQPIMMSMVPKLPTSDELPAA